MPVDANMVLQASVTKTATFNSVAIDLKSGTPSRGLTARINYSAATNASGANTCAFKLQDSTDNTTFYDISMDTSKDVALSTTAQAGEFYIPFRTSKQYVRLVLTITGAGSTPTITYQGDVALSLP